jgi:hypothetical protein
MYPSACPPPCLVLSLPQATVCGVKVERGSHLISVPFLFTTLHSPLYGMIRMVRVISGGSERTEYARTYEHLGRVLCNVKSSQTREKRIPSNCYSYCSGPKLVSISCPALLAVAGKHSHHTSLLSLLFSFLYPPLLSTLYLSLLLYIPSILHYTHLAPPRGSVVTHPHPHPHHYPLPVPSSP